VYVSFVEDEYDVGEADEVVMVCLELSNLDSPPPQEDLSVTVQTSPNSALGKNCILCFIRHIRDQAFEFL
jgi:hypothetical protein